jgi:hypothetical protein
VLELTAKDSAGLTTTVTRRLDPQTVQVTLQSSPTGLRIDFNGTSAAAPFTRTVIRGYGNTVSAITPQTIRGNQTYLFSSWSDGGAQTHTIAPRSNVTLTAKFRKR